MDFLPKIVVIPGTYPTEMLDQDFVWVDTDGQEYLIAALTEKQVIYALDYSLANAKMLREAWGMHKQETYDTDERARRWMINRPAIRGLMRRLGEIEDEEQLAAGVNALQSDIWESP